MQSEEDVRAYMQQHIWQSLEQCPTPLPFSEHKFWQPTTVGGLKGAPDWVALAYELGVNPAYCWLLKPRHIIACLFLTGHQ